jgi:hypothetical protein
MCVYVYVCALYVLMYSRFRYEKTLKDSFSYHPKEKCWASDWAEVRAGERMEVGGALSRRQNRTRRHLVPG